MSATIQFSVTAGVIAGTVAFIMAVIWDNRRNR